MAEYDSARSLATRLIAKKGRVLTVTKVFDDALPDSDRPWDPADAKAATPPPVSVRGVIVPITRAKIDDTLVRVNDKIAYVSAEAADDFEITLKDTITIAGTVHRIVEITDISPGEQKVLYILQLRA